MSDTREHRQDETAEQKTVREGAEGHVRGAEEAADKGLLSRKQADRLIQTGNKVHRSHDMARGLGSNGDGRNEG